RVAHGNLSCRKGRMLPHTGLFLLGKVALQMRIRRRLKGVRTVSDRKRKKPRFLPFVFEAEYLTAEIVQEDVFVFHA
ncbi:hypothetical protein, partial [Neisseria meningitidis]|uniref:hypothetical protein n=1 Tax=Neisseria meningitidis TaxID=487 RepID=UPI001C55D3F2